MIQFRSHGSRGDFVIVLHGGPGAAGYMAPVARGLSDLFRVLEPFQRGSGGQSLTVAQHVEDLHSLIQSSCAGAQPAMVGHSWGAMLALAYAAEHRNFAGPLALVGCGTFDSRARERMQATVEDRMSQAVRSRMQRLADDFPDPDERLRASADLLAPLYSYDLEQGESEELRCDAEAFEQSWQDMLRLQQMGVYPACFADIRSPVLMLHGAHDPHPGRMIRAGLQPYLPHLEYQELARCGHYPWRERAARAEFFAVLRRWLSNPA
ncbi:MAG TPA: alpha/beta hydrolase [Candidatus Binataceae bacterium]|nr:alpha/beta hydrolase [Candidatus Binataceae bacterium]